MTDSKKGKGLSPVRLEDLLPGKPMSFHLEPSDLYGTAYEDAVAAIKSGEHEQARRWELYGWKLYST